MFKWTRCQPTIFFNLQHIVGHNARNTTLNRINDKKLCQNKGALH